MANWDEDSITMAVEAAINCIDGRERRLIDGLYLATTTPPYREKQCASIVAAALDLRQNIHTLDVTGSLRSGTIALAAAADAIKAGSARQILVVAADSRLSAPNSELESTLGDGAAAFLLGDSDIAASVEGSYSLSSEFIDTWRIEQDAFLRTWEDRFVITHGYQDHLRRAALELMKQHRLASKDFAKAIFYAPSSRRHAEMARSLDFDPKTQVQDSLFSTVGNTGTAFAPMMLAAALEEAQPGQKFLLVNYGDGADAFILESREPITKLRDRRGIAAHLTSKMILPNYETYLRFRNLVGQEADLRPPFRTSLPVLWRERKQVFSLYGSRCKRCGTIHIPMQRVCGACQAKDDYEEVRLSDRKGKVFTYSMDERANVIDLPNVLCIIDLEGGGRFYSVMTDRDPAKIEIGMPVELTFRKINTALGVHNYFWKCRPIRA